MSSPIYYNVHAVVDKFYEGDSEGRQETLPTNPDNAIAFLKRFEIYEDYREGIGWLIRTGRVERVYPDGTKDTLNITWYPTRDAALAIKNFVEQKLGNTLGN